MDKQQEHYSKSRLSDVKRVYIVQLHLYEVLEQTKLIYNKRNHNSGYLWLGTRGGDDCE